jgi:hypothetical protein
VFFLGFSVVSVVFLGYSLFLVFVFFFCVVLVVGGRGIRGENEAYRNHAVRELWN